MLSFALTVLLAFHTVVGLITSFKDAFLPLSASRAIASYIKQSPYSNLPILADPDYVATSVAGYLDRPLYYAGRAELGTFAIWDRKRRWWSILTPAQFIEQINLYQAANHQDILVLLAYPLDLPPDRCPLLTQADRSAIPEERYWLYLAHVQPPTGEKSNPLKSGN
jgi:hypothetical protein